MGNKTIFILAALLLLIVSAAGGYFGPDWVREYRHAKEKADFVPAGVPDSVLSAFADDFEAVFRETEPRYLPDVHFLDRNGKKVRISDFAGKPTLVNMWATWCLPCVVELPSLDKLAKHYDGKLNVIGIAVEQGKPPAQIVSFLEKREAGDFAAYVDQSGDFAKNLGLQGLPTSFLIGSDGHILYRFVGDAVWTSPESREFFDIFLLQKR